MQVKMPHWALVACLCAGAAVAALMKMPESPMVMEGLMLAGTLLSMLTGQPPPSAMKMKKVGK